MFQQLLFILLSNGRSQILEHHLHETPCALEIILLLPLYVAIIIVIESFSIYNLQIILSKQSSK